VDGRERNNGGRQDANGAVYTVKVAGRTAVSQVGITALPATLADSLRRALDEQRTAEVDMLINKIEQCSVL
jgi:hypothetical protein